MTRNYSKATSMAILAVIYGIAIAIGCLTFDKASSSMPEIWAFLLADVVATIFVWGMGLVYENVSVYDPYWSVAPPVMFTAWAFYKGCWTLPVVLLLVAVWYWGIRLTGNWARTFKGLGHEDWVTWAGFAMCIASATIQLIADTQIHHFRESHPKQFCNVGLWKHGRHPNYFGEIQMWWGVWVMYASLNGIDWYIMAPIAMTCLFLFISIPMMERRQLENKPGYADYRKSTRILI